MKVVCFYFENRANLKSIAEIFYRYTPQIAVATDSIFLEIEQCSLIYSEEKFLDLSRSVFLQIETSPKIGISSSVPLARAQAYYRTKSLNLIPIDFLRYFLSPFEVLDERGEKTLSKILWYFEKLGLCSIQDFLKIPPRELSSRFGITGLLLHQRVSDSANIIWPKFIPEEKVFERREFDAEIELDSIEPILFILKTLLDTIHLRLVSRGKTLRVFEVRLLLEKASTVLEPYYPISIELAFTNPSTKALLQLFRDKATHTIQKNPLPGRITGVEVFVVETVPYKPTQRDIFNPKKEESEETYHDLVNRLSLKLGEKKVFKAALTESYLPEKNWVREKEVSDNPIFDNLPKRPLRIISEPIPLPYSEGKVFFNRGYIKLSEIEQYEVLFSEWWDTASERVYFRAKTNLGQDLWIYRSNQNYFLHGFFD